MSAGVIALIALVVSIADTYCVVLCGLNKRSWKWWVPGAGFYFLWRYGRNYGPR